MVTKRIILVGLIFLGGLTLNATFELDNETGDPIFYQYDSYCPLTSQKEWPSKEKEKLEPGKGVQPTPNLCTTKNLRIYTADGKQLDTAKRGDQEEKISGRDFPLLGVQIYRVKMGRVSNEPEVTVSLLTT